MIRILLFLFSTHVLAQSIDVTFRFVERPNDDFVRVFVPGTMPEGTSNDWGPNSNGFISPDAPSQMDLNETIDAYEKTYSLTVGVQYLYKIHFHHNSSGTNYSWIPDPLNPETTDDNYNNSILDVTDPLFFQPVRHLNEDGLVDGVSVGIFTSGTVDSILYAVGGDTLSGTEYYHDNGVFYMYLDPPMTLYDPVWIQASIDGELYTVYEIAEIDIVEEPLPEGVEMGPNWLDGTMILAVYAPSQPVMQVIVTSPGETGLASDAIVMNNDPNLEDVWWVELDLPAGDYEYEYLLMNGNRIPDPLSRRLTNGKTRIEIGAGGISTADNYSWRSDGYLRPELDTLIIYELHVDDFSAQGNGQGKFEDVIDRLDHLKSAGINAIELLPVTDFPGTHSWGYDPHLMSAVESRYGTPEEFKELVDEAHIRGMAVIMDMVWNHIRSSSPVWTIQPDYDLNPYIKLHTELNPNETEGSWGMLDWDHFNPHTIEYINRVNRIWVEEYRIDGFRFDATQMIGWDLNQPDYGMPAWTSALAEWDSTIYQIAEHLPAHPWLIDNISLTSSWHDSFHDILLSDAHSQYNSAATFMKQVVELHEYSNIGNSYSNRDQAVKYMISHDEQSIIQEMVVFNNFSLEEARERDKFYATILFTALGIPMVFQGQEFGLQTGWTDANNNGDYEEKLQYRPIDWALLETDVGQSHLDHYSRLARFLKTNPAFSRGTFYDLWRYEGERVIVYGYKDESEGNSDDQVVVIANFSSSDRTVTDVPFLSAGNWYNVTDPGNDLYTADGNYGEYSIPLKSAVVYSKNQYELGVETPSFVPEKFQTLSAYPNPFNPSITVQLGLQNVTQTNMNAKVNVYDVSGRFIQTLLERSIESGVHRIAWHPQNISSGIYIVSLKTKIGSSTQKILFLK